MGALGQLFGRIRANPWLGIAIAGGALLVIAWIAWAVYVWTDKGATQGLGVLIAVPALIVGAILVALPLVAIFVFSRGLANGPDPAEQGAQPHEQPEAEQGQVTEPG